MPEIRAPARVKDRFGLVFTKHSIGTNAGAGVALWCPTLVPRFAPRLPSRRRDVGHYRCGSGTLRDGWYTMTSMRAGQAHIDPDVLAAYAVDALTFEEMVGIAAHLHSCPRCQQEVASLRTAAGLLPYTLPESMPPPALRDRIMQAAQTGQPVPSRVAPHHVHPKAWGRAWLRRLAPALAALTFVLGLLLGRVWPAGPGFPIRSDRQTLTLAGQGSGTVLVANNHSYVRVMATGLPPLEPGQVYQLWLLGRRVPISAGTFPSASDGSGRFELNGLAWSPEYTGIAITIEPVGGNAAPTSDIVAKADL